ncbi:hypothetical protein DFQ26_000039 [Actinomortierella ambigua]|nr:hypothetical protein DFQ26_000039 [Actinomortierella ambigua]
MLEHLEYTQRRQHPVVKALRGRFPCLKSIVLDQLADLQKQDIATIVSDIPTLTRFHGQQFMPLGQATLDSLIARHAHTLTHVNIRQTTYDIHFEGIYCNGSPNYLRILLTAKQILLFPENCPNLVEFHAPMVEATSLVRSAHWACVHSLRVLVLGIFIVDQTLIAAKTGEGALHDDLYTDTVRDEPWFVRQFAQPHQDTKRRLRIQRCPSRRYLRLNRAVFERLSHLTTLETLDISNPYKEQVSAPGALSLSFEGGLGKLGQLRRLRTFGFHQYPENKTPRKYEYLWMMQRWPMLQCLRLKECSVFQFEFPFVFVKDWVPGARIMPWTIELDHSERLPYELYRNPFIP